MTTIYVSSSSELKAALNTAKGGDTISLASGNYGDLSIKGKMFSSDINIVSSDAGNPATFHSITINQSANINFSHVDVDFVPTATTYAFSNAVWILDSSGVTMSHGKIVGGNAINGVSPESTTLDSTGNVKGLATGVGVSIQKSSDVTIDHMEISHLVRGIGMGQSNNVTITNNEIYDLRKTGIFGGASSNVVVDSNHIYDSNPWRWGDTPVGDHADFIAFWTDPKLQTTDSQNIKVTNNLMEQGKGVPILGMWFQGQGDIEFEGVRVEGNTILNGNLQGITMKGVNGGQIIDNTLLQTDGTVKTTPGILLYDKTKYVEVSGNDTGSVHNMSNNALNKFFDNTIVQRFDPSQAGYYDLNLINSLSKLDVYGALQGVDIGKGDSGAVVSPPVTLPPITTPAPSGVNGSAGHDALVGTSAAETIKGAEGNDTITSGGGADTIFGGAGSDTFVYKPYSGKDVIMDFGIGGKDFLDISAMTSAKLKPALADDAAAGGVTLKFATGDVITLKDVQVKDLVSVNGGYTIAQRDPAPADPHAGAESLTGTAGADSINAGGGDDVIFGGAGADTLAGGAGSDTFIYKPYNGKDVITDFGVDGKDFLDLSGMTAMKLKPWLTQVGDNTTVNFANGDVITLMGVHTNELVAVNGGFVSV
jgi:Ca2+-binding RTX toxin-like protein